MSSSIADSLGLDEWMVAWEPGKPNAVRVGPWPDSTGWSDEYGSTTGCCDMEWHDLGHAWKVARLFIDFHTLVAGDGMDPLAVHREFLKITEFRRRISSDIAGAEPDGA